MPSAHKAVQHVIFLNAEHDLLAHVRDANGGAQQEEAAEPPIGIPRQ
jgi:hypothetical protein